MWALLSVKYNIQTPWGGKTLIKQLVSELTLCKEFEILQFIEILNATQKVLNETKYVYIAKGILHKKKFTKYQVNKTAYQYISK